MGDYFFGEEVMVHLTSTPLSALGDWVSANEHGVPPCGRACFLLLRQKKIAKEKATPGAAPFGSLALLGEPGTPRVLPRAASHRSGRGLPELACGSDKASRQPPARLRCSAPSTGTRKASVFNRGDLNLNSHGQPEKKPKNETHRFSVDALPGPLRGAEQRRGWRKEGEDCLRAQPEFRSPRQNRVAQGTGAAGTDPGGAFSLATFFWRSKRKYARPQGGTPCPLAPRRPQKGKAQRKAPHA